MIFNALNSPASTQSAHKLAGLLLAFFITMIMVVPEAEAQFYCPGTDGSIGAGQLVVLEQCTHFLGGSDADAITIDKPTLAQEGDFLIAVINTDGDELPFTIAPTADGFTLIREDEGNGITFAIYSKFVGSTEPANYTWDLASNEQRYAYMMLFTGASGKISPDPVIPFNEGTSASPLTPAITTAIANTLVLRMAVSDDDDILINPAEILPGGTPAFSNIASNSSSLASNAVSGQAVYRNAQTAALYAAENFTIDFASNEYWKAITLGVEPLEFKFSYPDGNTQMSLCAIGQVTLRVTNTADQPVTGFGGTVSLSTTGAASATLNFSDPAALGNFGTLTPGALNSGAATYDFSPLDGGEITLEFTTGTTGALNFDLDYLGRFSENGGADDLALVVDDNCAFAIDFTSNTAGTCSAGPQEFTLSILDSAGDVARNYAGTVNLTLDLGAGGNYATSGAGVFVQGTLDDGAADYTFDLTDQGAVTFTYSSTLNTAQTININAIDEDPPVDYVTGATDENLVYSDCEVRISYVGGDDTRDVCSIAQVIFTITDSAGGVVTAYDGDLDLTTDSFTGDWSGTVPGVLDNTVNGTGNGEANYAFSGAEGGIVTIDFRNPFIDADLTIAASGIAGNGAAVILSGDISSDPTLDIAGCSLTIDVASATNQSDVCRVGEIVTYTITDRDSVTATDFNGFLVLQTDGLPNIGDYSLPNPASSLVGGFGAFNNGSSNDGIATYQFDSDAGDGGILEVLFTVNAVATVVLDASSSGITVDNSDGSIEFEPCEFRIAFPDVVTVNQTDVCSVELVRISLFDIDGDPVTDYTGSINLSSSSGDGSWTINNADGIINDPVAEDGSASYAFEATDLGTIDLNFVHTASNNASVNINVSDTVTTDPGNPGSANDPNLAVDLCTFTISLGLGSTTACAVHEVTIQILDSSSNPPANNYTGTINLSTSTNNGDWGIGSGLGTLDPNPDNDDNGAASYTFDATDGNIVQLDFTNSQPETLSFDLVDQVEGLDGVIVEDGAADPDLIITSCLPAIDSGALSCVNAASTSINVSAQNPDPALRGRMVIMVVEHEGTVDVNNFPTFGGNNMTFIYQEKNLSGAGNTIEMWGILDADFPAGTGPHVGSYSGPVNSPYMCLLPITDVEQKMDWDAAGETGTDNDPVNGSQGTISKTSSTTVTSTANNSLILSVVGSSHDAGTQSYDLVAPSPPLTELFVIPSPPPNRPIDFKGSSGVLSTAGVVQVDETYDQFDEGSVPDLHAHIVASISPLVSGPAISNDFTPVRLHRSYAGNVSYRAIGASVRTGHNLPGPQSCVGNNFASADLNLPDENPAVAPFVGEVGADSSVVAAWLYWFASGDIDAIDPGSVYEQVTFVDPSLTATVITAEELFIIDNVGNANDKDYFAGFKDVTALVSGSGTYTVQDIDVDWGAPWRNSQACVGGWSMVVVYDNPFEQLRVINLFQGFQPVQDSSITLVPRNFRMAAPDLVGEFPNGQITHITMEGDEDAFDDEEGLKIQPSPGETDPGLFNPLFNDYNPLFAEFNSTITRPIYDLVDIDPSPAEDWVYLFDPLSGANGYEIDFQGPDLPPVVEGEEPGASWGVDVDTHYISGDGDNADGDGDVLNSFGTAGAEQFTNRYTSGGDFVAMVAEVVSVTNAPIADIEVFKTEVGDFKVNSSDSSYQFEVTNNGNGATSFGEATGIITLSDTLPLGMTFAAPGDVSGTGWDCTVLGSVQLDPGAFTCVYDVTSGELDEDLPGNPGFGKSLPTLTANVTIDGPPTFFPSLNNDAKNVVRVLHAEGSCTAATGVSPDPAGVGCLNAPEFDNVNDLQNGLIDINTLFDKTGSNNNVDSITSNVKGSETDLGIVKAANGVLEEDEPDSAGQYTLTITNFGPDDITPTMATPTITVTDIESSFIEFTTVDAATDPDWTCNIVDGSPDTLSCTFDGTLLFGGTTNIILNVDVTGVAGNVVSNTASVDSGLYNFDTNAANDSDTDISVIVPHPVASSERFLLSVSSPLGVTTIGTGAGELVDFENDDLIIFDPVLDEATMFFDNSALGYGVDDINAAHLLPNGQIILSANAASTIGSPVQAFDKHDLVLYDPISLEASIFFDGSIMLPTLPATDVNIDAVYVLDNGDAIFSTTEGASIGGIFWLDSDLVLWDGATASIYLEGADPDVFGASVVQLDAAYVRADPADATAVIDTFVFSADNQGATVGDDNTGFGRDDVVELVVDDHLNPDVTSSEHLFAGNIPIGVFSAVDNERRLNALHILEDDFMGHFAISQAQSGSACVAGKITISKHQGLSHDIDTDYAGAIEITTSTSEGSWSIDTGNGTLVNIGSGQAVYTFVPSDNGQVTLSLNVTEEPPVAKVLNVNVTNRIVTELGTEDPNFNFNLVITPVTYSDEFSLDTFDNNNGSTGWDGDWVEVDDVAAGAAGGNVSVSGGALHLTSTPATINNPSVTRDADMSLYAVTETVFLNFDYSYADLNVSDELTVLARDGNGGFVTVATYTGLSGSSGFIAESIDLTTALAPADFSIASAQIRFEITNGYTLNSVFNIDNVEIATGTSDCGIGQIHHFDIDVVSPGIACMASTITITGHDSNHFPAAAGHGTVINLSTSTGAGTWASVLMGATNNLADVVLPEGLATNVDGQGVYTFFGEEDTVQLRFNYTDPATDGAVVDIDIGGVYTEQQDVGHDPTISFDEIGLLFFDDFAPDGSLTLPFQIAGKPSATLPSSGNVTLQIVRSVSLPDDTFGAGNSSLACESMVPDQTTARIKLAAVCEDPGTCAATDMSVVDAGAIVHTDVPVVPSSQPNPFAESLDVDLLFENQPTIVDGRNNIGATINFSYPDVGKISLHAEFDIPFDDDIAGVRSGDVISGASGIFTVRPFGFDVDFSDDREGGPPLSSFAADAAGPPFARAGADFNATISSVVWESEDDANQDGVPDTGADLSDNPVTGNYGQENAGAGAGGVVELSVSSANPGVPTGVNGSIVTGKEIFSGFANGSKTQSIAIDEVGIFDLEAVLVESSETRTPIDYFSDADAGGVVGGVSSVGRIYPNNFALTSGVLSPRINQAMVCADDSVFTYMGEDFELSLLIEAKNAQGATTVNYRGEFANLTTFEELDIRAIIDVEGEADIDLNASGRLFNSSIGSPAWVAGSMAISGDMYISRPVGGGPEPPLTSVQIVIAPIDDNNDDDLGAGVGDDVLLDVLNVDLDDGISEPGAAIFRIIPDVEPSDETHEFRYGRLLVDNAYGPETEPLGIPLRLEYYDSDSNFVINSEDSCTAFVSTALGYIASSYEAPLVDGDTVIEQAGDVTVTVFQGQTNRLADGDNDDANDPDRPFTTTAPLLEHTGRVLVEFDLLGESLPTELDFLRYDWRIPADLDEYNDVPNLDYTDNPRGVIEFGNYRGHDRVLNWQEIPLGPSL